MPAEEPFGRVIGLEPWRSTIVAEPSASKDAIRFVPPIPSALNLSASACMRNSVVLEPTPTMSSASGVKAGSAVAGPVSTMERARAPAAAAAAAPVRRMVLRI